MDTRMEMAFRGRPTKRNHKAYKAVSRSLQAFGVYALGMAGTFAWGFFQAAGTTCGNGVDSCLILAGSVTSEAAVWPLYWGPKLLGAA